MTYQRNAQHGMCRAVVRSGHRALSGLAALLVSFALLLSGVAWGLGALVPVEQARADTNQTVKAGVFAFDGYHEVDANGNYTGYGIEVLEMISKYSHINFELVGYDRSWNDMLTMLENGEIDVVTSASRTPEREKKFDYSLPIGKKSAVLSVNINNNRFVAGNYATYNGMVVGEIPGNSLNQEFADFARDKGFSFSVVQYSDTEAMVQALQNGSVDAILTSDLRKSTNEKTLESISDDNYYAIVRKGETELLSEINYAIEQMNMYEGDWKNTLFYQYYGPSYSNDLEFTDREQAYINAVRAGEKKIVATAFVDRRPYSFKEHGEQRGILIDYFSAVMDVADLPYELVMPDSLAEYERLIDEEEVNVVVDGITGEYASTDFFANGFSTNVFMNASVVEVTRNDFSGDIESIAVSDSSTGSLDAFFANQSGKRLIHYPTREQALQAVLDGQADCAYVYVYTAQEFMNRDLTNSLSYKAVYGLDVKFDMRVSANTDHELVGILNKCIKQVPQATLNRLVAEYTTSSVNDLSFFEYLLANPAIIIVLCLIVLLIVAVIVALVLRGKWNERLIASQEKSNQQLQEQLSIVEALSRDYTNVFAVDEKSGTAKIVKLEGYVTEGLTRDSKESHDYGRILTTYINDRVHPDDKQQLRDELALENVSKNVSVDGEYSGTYRVLDDGEVHNFQYTYVVVKGASDDESAAGADSFILVGFRNIDDAVRKEQEQKEVLSEALEQAEYANIAKTTFLNSMSHDIRTPMNAIIGFTTLAERHIDDTGQVQDYLEKIMTSSNHLLSLINDVLDMSRIESGKVKIDSNEVSLAQILQDLRTIVQTDADTKGIAFGIDMQVVANDKVVCDKLRLNQVLLNIISNAIKYTKPGGSVDVIVSQHDTDLENRTAEYRFAVRDTGIGMSKTFLEHVFEPFEREETATVSGIQGTGLGLAITKNIIDLMGGSVEVTSEEGKGSEFTVSLRLEIPEGSEQAGAPVDLDGSGDQSTTQVEDIQNAFERAAERFKGTRVLLAEDNAMSREIAKTVLEDAEIVVDAVEDGKYAVERMQEMPAGSYDVVLTDVQMPIMNGYETTRAIRALDDPAKASIPIIAVTANAFEEDREEAEAAGMSGYVPKPIDVRKLFEVLDELLGE